MFYNQYYTPNNSTLVITGDFEIAETKLLVNKYFQDINPSLEVVNRFKQDKSLLEFGNSLVVNDPIAPLNAVFMLFHLPEQNSPDYRALELLSTILGDGESSRLYKTLEYQLEIASDTESYIFEGSLCSMLFIYSIADNNKISASKLEKEIINCIQIIGSEGITVEELEKAKNKNESRINYYIQSLMNRAERLAYFSSFYDNPNMAFNESKLFSNISIEDIKRVCNKYLVDQKHNSVSYFVNK
jgi:predicted Zn-dependent peptidase